MNPVAAGLRSHINHGIARTFGLRKAQVLLARNSERQCVHERVLRVARFKRDFTADRWHAKTIPVAADSTNHPVQNPPVPRGFLFACRARSVDLAKTQRIEHGDGPRTHGEDVAQNPADSGGRPLKWFHVARMVVRFDLERRHEPVAEIHDTGVFPGALHHEPATRRQPLQMHLARFVGAMLAPHHAEDSEFRDVRIAPQDFLDPCVLFRGYPVFRRNLRRHLNLRLCRRHRPP